MSATVASFFSGVGGMDLGLERAGWRPVSFSEIDPYASAVLARHWPDVPNLGDIAALAELARRGTGPERERRAPRAQQRPGRSESGAGHHDWHAADLWTGGFPCQDLSVAGKRRGLHHDGERTRSGLAFAFLDLVERYAGPRRADHAILLENVPGLLSSNAGRDFGALIRALLDLGYGVAWRVVDSQFFGVPQRRRRVFILALRRGGRPDAECAAEVLAVGAGCGRDHAEEREAWAAAARGVASGAGRPGIVGALNDLGHHGWTANAQSVAQGHIVAAVTAKWAKGAGGPAGDEHHNLVTNGSVPTVIRARHGSAGDGDERQLIIDRGKRKLQRWPDLTSGGSPEPSATTGSTAGPVAGVTPNTTGAVNPLGASPDASGDGAAPGLPRRMDDRAGLVAATLNCEGNEGGFRTESGEHIVIRDADGPEDDLLPAGLDSHRYRCCGNGVSSPVAEWIGRRLLAALAPRTPEVVEPGAFDLGDGDKRGVSA